jgi:hypothetical protein
MATIYPKDYFAQLSGRMRKATCFVLIPFEAKFREVYDLIRNTLESEDLNIECKRADDFHQPHIIETILENIARSEYVVADLTDSNANVFYELGLAHSFKNIDEVIILTQDMRFVPFDLRHFRCIVYEQTIAGSRDLKTELIKTFNESSKNAFRFKLKENSITPFDKRLAGKNKFLVELKFECVWVGLDGIKLQVHFVQCAADKSRMELETQFMYLGIDENPGNPLKHIPWSISLLRTDGTVAIISLDKN